MALPEGQKSLWLFRVEIFLTFLSILMLLLGDTLRCSLKMLDIVKLCCLIVMLVMCVIAKIFFEKAGQYFSFAKGLQWEVLRIPSQFFLFSLPQNYGIGTMQDFATECEVLDPHWISVVYIGSWIVGLASFVMATCNRSDDRRSLAPKILCVGIFSGAMGLIVTRGISWGVLLLQVNDSFLDMTIEAQVSMILMVLVNSCLLVRNFTVCTRKCMSSDELPGYKAEEAEEQETTEAAQEEGLPPTPSDGDMSQSCDLPPRKLISL